MSRNKYIFSTAAWLRPRNGRTAAVGIFAGRMGANQAEFLPLRHKNDYSGATVLAAGAALEDLLLNARSAGIPTVFFEKTDDFGKKKIMFQENGVSL